MQSVPSEAADIKRQSIGTPITFRWGPQRPDLIRYNRIEGLSVGVRGQARPRAFGTALTLTASARMGTAAAEPVVRFAVSRATELSGLTLSVFNELAAIDPRARHLGVGNSLLAATVGRDDGDYYRHSGVWIELRSPTPAPTPGARTFGLRAFAEYHRPASVQTDLALFHLGEDGWAFRPNLMADEGWEYGVLADLDRWWGDDPGRTQGGFGVSLRAAAGDFRYVRAVGTARVEIPLAGDFGVALESALGAASASSPAQQRFYLGGPASLHGYAPRRLEGESFGRIKAELLRRVSFGAVEVFAEWAWAGARDRIAVADSLYSIGSGVSILDGMIRIDAGWGLRNPGSFRADLYLDAIR